MISEQVNQLIRNRRSVYPPQFIDQKIPQKVIWDLLENANWAPTHKLTQPWRFKVITGASRRKLGIFMSEKYRSLHQMESFSVAKYEKLKTNPQRAGAVIAICIKPDERKRVPEWEEVASVAMAVQNLWLSAASHNLGGYWSTPDMIQYFGEFDQLEEGERCIGLFYLGYFISSEAKPPRKPIEDKVKWID